MALINQFAKNPKSMQELWPLGIDDNQMEQLTEDELYERNKKIIENYKRTIKA